CERCDGRPGHRRSASLDAGAACPTACFLSLAGTPPTFPLSPYTTLFRSLLRERRRRRSPLLEGTHRRRRRIAVELELRREPVLLDRKSTRLNSSHVKSSYAVFCLKKKNGGSRSNAESKITQG